jgi:adenylate cyclase class 2
MALYEIERKRLVPDEFLETLEESLRLNKFTQTGILNESDAYFSRTDVDYMKTVECLRIRQQGDKAEITYKPPTNSSTTTDGGIIIKHEVNVGLLNQQSALEAHELLAAIGMVRLVEVKKHRRVFRSAEIANASIVVDKITRAGIFIEVEVMSHNKAKSIQLLEQIEQQLGLTHLEVSRRPYRDIVMEIES